MVTQSQLRPIVRWFQRTPGSRLILQQQIVQGHGKKVWINVPIVGPDGLVSKYTHWSEITDEGRSAKKQKS